MTVTDVDIQAGLYPHSGQDDLANTGSRKPASIGWRRSAAPCGSIWTFINRAQVERNWFLPSPKGKRWHPDNFSGRLRNLNEGFGLSWSCLDYRHTFGSQLAMKGEILFKISNLTGNSPEVCREHHAFLLPESMLSSVEF